MQNLVFGVFVAREKLTDEQFELVVNDESHVETFYNGNCPMGGDDPLIGIKLKVLQDNRPFNLTRFIESFDHVGKVKSFDELMKNFKISDIFKDKAFEGFDIEDFCYELGEPMLIIIPETD